LIKFKGDRTSFLTWEEIFASNSFVAHNLAMLAKDFRYAEISELLETDKEG
jgi:hypothetical protein